MYHCVIFMFENVTHFTVLYLCSKMLHIFFYGWGGGSVEVYNVFDLKECLIILQLYILPLLIIVSFSISVIFNMYKE